MFGKKRFWGMLIAAMVFTFMAAGISSAAQTPGPDGEKTGLYRDYIAKLAVNLGIEQSKVEAALQATKEQMLSDAVKQGRLTKEEADRLAQSANPFCVGEKRPHGKEGGRYLQKDIATVLGIAPEQLNSDLKSGKKLIQIISERGLTKDQFRQKMLETKKESLSQAVKNRKLTQQQADENLQRMDKKLESLLSE